MAHEQLMEKVKGNRTENLAVTIDVSSLMSNNDYRPTRLEAAIEAIIALLAIKRRLFSEDLVGIVRFCDTGEVVHRLVNVREGTPSLINSLRALVATSSTNIHDCLKASGELLNKRGDPSFPQGALKVMQWVFGHPPAAEEPTTHLKRILLLTDGEHNGDGNPISIAQKLKAKGIVIECIGIGGSPADVNESDLRAIATTDRQGFNHYWFIGDSSQLIKKFGDLSGYLRPMEGNS